MVCYSDTMSGMTDDEAERRLKDRARERRVWEEIGHRIRRARIARDMSVEELAVAVGLSTPAVYRLEVGVLGTTISRLRDFARILQLDLVDLIDGSDDVDATASLRVAFRGKHLTPEQVDELVRYAEEHFAPEEEIEGQGDAHIDTN